jgi:putative transposase
MRKIKLENEKYYHIYNRGANKQEIFLDEKDYFKFLNNLWEFNNELGYDQRRFLIKKYGQLKLSFPNSGKLSFSYSAKKIFKEYSKLVEIIAYSFLPNHFHFILKQLTDKGIEKFMHKAGIGYTKYFNSKYNHSGVLFQGPFQAFPINTENKLCQLSTYVNCNYEIHKLGVAESWQFSSFQDYLNLRKGSLCNKNEIFKLFNNNIDEYKKYCKFVIKDSQDIKKWQKFLIE